MYIITTFFKGIYYNQKIISISHLESIFLQLFKKLVFEIVFRYIECKIAHI